MEAKRAAVNLDPRIVADAKIALWEAQRAGLEDIPLNLSDMLAIAVNKEIEALRKKARKVAGRGVIGRP